MYHTQTISTVQTDEDQLAAEQLSKLREEIRQAMSVCVEAARGNLEPRVLMIDDNSELAGLLHSVNHLLDMTDAFVRESVASLQHSKDGQFYRRVLLDGMLGSFGTAAVSINDATTEMEIKTGALNQAESRRAALADDFKKATNVVHELAHASEEISNISNLIGQIASQSNLLALNASIESARAGEAGAGFGVVANEVKRLADRTAAATNDIYKKVTAIQTASQDMGVAVEKIRCTIHGSNQEEEKEE